MLRAARRRTLLPVLSRRWASLLHAPGPAWAEVDIDTDADFSWEGGGPSPVAMVAWFTQRSGSVRSVIPDWKLTGSCKLEVRPISFIRTCISSLNPEP